MKNLNFRKNSFGIFCPFVEFDLNNLPFSLTGIQLGPKLSDKDLNRAQLRYFLNAKSLNHVTIDFSGKIIIDKKHGG